MRLVLFDYGTGNLHSLRKALERQGAEVDTGADLAGADGLVLPGVGAFGAAAARLEPHRAAIREAVAAGLPVLGICLGMQLLLDASEEGAGRGLGLIPGRSRRLQARRVPHMGWNTVEPVADPERSRGAGGADGSGGSADTAWDAAWDAAVGAADVIGRSAGERFYFANSYVVVPDDPGDIAAWTEHDGDRFPAAVRRGAVLGTQFHPEKSGAAGLALLGRFIDSVRAARRAQQRRRAPGYGGAS